MFAIILYRALNRTVFLRKKIINGRGRRSYQLKLVATQRKKKHDQLLNVSYRYKFECWFYNLRNPSMTTCHGCNKDTKKKYIHEVTFENVIVNILDARWRFKIVCLQTKLVSLVISNFNFQQTLLASLAEI